MPAASRRLPLLVALASAAVLVPTAGASAASLTPATRAAAFAPVIPRGGVTLPPGSHDLGRLRPQTELHLTVALRPHRARALAAYAAAVATPGSVDYHRYLSVSEFAQRFAPSGAEVRAVRAGLRARGLLVGATSPNHLSIAVRGTALVTADAFSTEIDRYALRGGATEDVPTAAPELGGAAGSLVQGIVGLDTVAPTAAVRIRRPAAEPTAHLEPHAGHRPRVTHAGRGAAGPRSCSSAGETAAENDGETASQIADHYGLQNFWAAGDEGSGTTIAVYELEPFSASDLANFQQCMGTSTPVTLEAVDGGAGSGFGSGEAATDIEDLVGLAPKAQIRVYEGPPTGAGAYDTYSAIIAQDAAQVVTTSWGLCEADAGRSSIVAESTLFQEAAVQGQSVLAASGDQGADDCGNGTLSADDPGTDPWVTAVGGTHFIASGDTVWNDALGAGGGGASEIWGRPAWQTSYESQSWVSCGASGTSCREVPDISADADPATGYAAYYHGAWRIVGGTSLAAPTVAALAALAEASPACDGARLGFLDPALYADAADVHDVTAGTDSSGGVTGFAATPGFDMASGLGTPTAALGPALCGDAVSFTAPTAQDWLTGRPVALALSAQSVKGAALSFSATGLPAGLVLAPSTGLITGTPTAPGSFTVTATALDADGATQTGSFTATVTSPSPSPPVATPPAKRAHQRTVARRHRHHRRPRASRRRTRR